MNEKLRLKIGDCFIGDSEPVYLIAEIGINHNGDMQIAKKLIDATWATGWNCAKFQKRAPDLAVPDAQKNVLRQTPWGEMTYLEYKKRIEFEKKEYDYISKYCKEKPIDWTASVWDLPSLEFLMQYDIPFIKIPSAKITDKTLVGESAKTGKPLFFSTGMSTIEEVDNIVNIAEKYLSKNYVLFHCNSSYPAKLDELNLNMIRTFKERYNCLVGYSGHEDEIMPSTIAPVYGACIIERHITLDHNMWGTDQKASLEIRGMDALARRVHSVRLIAGDGVKVISGEELKVRQKLRG
jgi:N-acetylneuraminate synthase